MKNLFFVAVAIGIFSGTSISAIAQTSVNQVKLNDVASRQSPHFIEGIEINQERIVMGPNEPVVAKPVSTPKISKVPVQEFGNSIENCSPLQFKFAQLMQTDVEAIQHFSLFRFIDNWWGTRYRYGGKTKQGVDCSAYSGTLINEVYQYSLPRTAREQYAVCDRVNREELREGDLVFFNTKGGISHVGVYLGNGYFTHSSVRSGVTISSLDEDYYRKKFLGGGRINTVAAAEEAE